MSSIQHIELQDRKTLCGRLRILGETIQHEANPNLHPVRQAFEQWRTDLLTIANDPTSKRFPNHIRLDRDIEKLRLNVPSVLAFRAQSAAEQQVLKPIADSLEHALAQVDCLQCAVQAGGSICCGAISDDHVVAAAGHCLEPLHHLCALAIQETTKLYRNHAANPNVINKIKISFSTYPLNQGPSFRYAPHIMASTQISGNDSMIKLNLRADSFCKRSFLAALYLLVHECVAHVFQGAKDVRLRQPTVPEDEFAEGWMDFVAFELVQQLSNSAAGGVDSRQLAQARLVHEERSDADEVVSQGRTAFEIQQEKACRFLSFNGRDAAWKFRNEVGWPNFLKISLDANLEAGLNSERRQFVATVQNLLTPTASKTAKNFIQTELHNYLQSRDIRRFLNAFCGRTPV